MPLRCVTLSLALLSIASAQSLQCDNVLCFAGPINDGVVLQRAPAHAAVLGSVPRASPAAAPMSLTLAGVDGAGAAYNKSFAFAAMADFTWKLVLPDAFELGGNFTMTVTCATCAGGVTSIWRTNATFGDVWVCSGQVRSQLRCAPASSPAQCTLSDGHVAARLPLQLHGPCLRGGRTPHACGAFAAA